MLSIRWKFDGIVSIETDDAYYRVGTLYAPDGTLFGASMLDLEINIGEVPESIPDRVTRLLSPPGAFEEARHGAARTGLQRVLQSSIDERFVAR